MRDFPILVPIIISSASLDTRTVGPTPILDRGEYLSIVCLLCGYDARGEKASVVFLTGGKDERGENPPMVGGVDEYLRAIGDPLWDTFAAETERRSLLTRGGGGRRPFSALNQ